MKQNIKYTSTRAAVWRRKKTNCISYNLITDFEFVNNWLLRSPQKITIIMQRTAKGICWKLWKSRHWINILHVFFSYKLFIGLFYVFYFTDCSRLNDYLLFVALFIKKWDLFHHILNLVQPYALLLSIEGGRNNMVWVSGPGS